MSFLARLLAALALLAATPAFALDAADGPMVSAGGDRAEAADASFELASLHVGQRGPWHLARVHSVSSSPPPAAYDPGGVQFQPETSIKYTSAPNFNGGVDTTHLIACHREMGERGVQDSNSPPNDFRDSAFYGTPGNGVFNSEANPGFLTNSDTANWVAYGVGWSLRSTSATAAGVTSGQPSIVWDIVDFFYNMEWVSVCTIQDTSGANNAKKVAIYRNGVFAGDKNQITDGAGSLTTAWNNASPPVQGFQINDAERVTPGIGGGGFAFNIADLFIDTKTPIPAGCLANFPTAANPAPAQCMAIINAYYQAGVGPIDPGPCAANLLASYGGTTPDIYTMHGGKATALTNCGTAGPATFTLINDLTSSSLPPAIYDSPFGQGAEPSDRPYLAWPSTSQYTTSSSSTTFDLGQRDTGGGINAMGNQGNLILKNDRLIAFVNGPCYTSTPTAGTLTITGATTGWSWVTTTTSTNPFTTLRCVFGVATYVAPQDIVAAKNTPWRGIAAPIAPVAPPTFTYSTTGTNPKVVGYTLVDYRSKNGVVNIDVADGAANTIAAQTSCVAPSITTTKAPATLVVACLNRNGNIGISPPADLDMRITSPWKVSNAAYTIVADKKLTATGATGTKTFTYTASTQYYYAVAISLTNF